LLNIFTLEGFLDGLVAERVPRAHIGFYSTALQWKEITGLTASTSRRYFLASHDDWVAGAKTLEQARANCSTSRSFSGGHVALTQFVTPDFDGDYRCR
jgi:hypothetical protein